MVRPQFRSRSLRRLTVKAPGHLVRHYARRAPGQARCGQCHSLLHGMPRLRPSALRHTPKTSRRPERPYGGVLCSRCMRARLKQ